jgi:hypothetical protein
VGKQPDATEKIAFADRCEAQRLHAVEEALTQLELIKMRRVAPRSRTFT